MKTKPIMYESPGMSVLLVNLTHSFLQGSAKTYPKTSSESFDSEFDSIGW